MESIISIILFICIFIWIALLGASIIYMKNVNQWQASTTTTTPPTQYLLSNGTTSCDLLCRMGGFAYDPNDKPCLDSSCPMIRRKHTPPQDECLKVINRTKNGLTYSCSETPLIRAKGTSDILCGCLLVTEAEWIRRRDGIITKPSRTRSPYDF